MVITVLAIIKIAIVSFISALLLYLLSVHFVHVLFFLQIESVILFSEGSSTDGCREMIRDRVSVDFFSLRSCSVDVALGLKFSHFHVFIQCLI